MFRRNYKRGKRPSGFRRRTPLARVKRTWVQSLLLDPCDPQIVDLCSDTEQQCCTTRWEQVILDNAVLQSQFSDRARVVRIVGDVLIGFDPRLGLDPAENFNRLATAFGSLYVQLIKRPINGTGNAELPPDIWDSTSVIEGYSESKALKTWWHFWNPFDGFQTTGTAWSGVMQTAGLRHFFEDCLGTEVGLGGQITSGSGTFGAVTCPGISLPSDPVKLASECVPCGELNVGNILNDGTIMRTPRAWHFHLDLRKRIALREDEQLNLDFQFRSPFSSVFPSPPAAMVMLQGGIKTLLEF